MGNETTGNTAAASPAQLQLLCDDIDRYLHQLAPHAKEREAAQLLKKAANEMRNERMRNLREPEPPHYEASECKKNIMSTSCREHLENALNMIECAIITHRRNGNRVEEGFFSAAYRDVMKKLGT